MFRDLSRCNTYNYGDALYWDARYIQEAGSFDWYQRYSALRPFVRKYVPTSSRILMVGCGNAVMSEDMVKDGYSDIINIDISSVAIDMMRRKYEQMPQLKYMQMDVRDMSFFPDDSFDTVIDKGTLDSLMCGTDAPISASQMLGEVSRLLKPGGVYMLITSGDPNVRMPHIGRPVYNWMIELYVIRFDGSNNVSDYIQMNYLKNMRLVVKVITKLTMYRLHKLLKLTKQATEGRCREHLTADFIFLSMGPPKLPQKENPCGIFLKKFMRMKRRLESVKSQR